MVGYRSFWSALALAAIAMPAFGGLTAPKSLLDLEQRADLIVVGAVASPFPAAPVTSFSITVDRIIKGDGSLAGGMGAFANGLPMQTRAGVPGLTHLQLPAAAPYRTDDTMRNFALGPDVIASNMDSYLGFWKQWWSVNRSVLPN
jgi:hypothetical protein